ncbi:MAG: hypothetical protein V1916_01420 [Patescibacteria group bacterium]
MKSKFVPLAFAVFGLMCGIFGFFTEVRDIVVVINSAFFLQMAIVSFLAAIFFEHYRKN